MTTQIDLKSATHQNNQTHRTQNGSHKGPAGKSPSPDSAGGGTEISNPDDELVLRCEQLFGAIRLSRSLINSGMPESGGAVVEFPTLLVIDGVVHDLELTASPGYFAEGHHTVVARGVLGTIEVRGKFEISVGSSFGLAPEAWIAIDAYTGLRVSVPATIQELLPRSIHVPSAPSLIGATRRVHLQAERARAELLRLNGGLVRSVVNRFRGVIRTESALMDLNDLVSVGEQQLLEVADRYFTDPDTSPTRTVAWSKLVRRAVGNALRSEIARVTGISVEFRQLLTWYHAHPGDRELPAEIVARRMAFSAGVSRLMSARNIRDRAAAFQLLEELLASGEAQYVAPGRGANETSQQLRSQNVFVISSRSSLAEIERARSFTGTATPLLDTDADQDDRNMFLSILDPGYEVADLLDAVRSVIERSNMTALEAAVWLHRTGVLDPGGHGTELPDIAVDLGLTGRSEARAALRRARRKIEAWSGDPQEILNEHP